MSTFYVIVRIAIVFYVTMIHQHSNLNCLRLVPSRQGVAAEDKPLPDALYNNTTYTFIHVAIGPTVFNLYIIHFYSLSN